MIRSASYPSLEDRVAFVTGGAAGSGLPSSRTCAPSAPGVAFMDIARAASEAVVASLQARGYSPPVFLPCDVRDIAALQAAVAEVGSRLGPIRALLDTLTREGGRGVVRPRHVPHA